MHAMNNECLTLLDYYMDFSAQTIAFQISNYVLWTLKLDLDSLECREIRVELLRDFPAAYVTNIFSPSVPGAFQRIVV